MDDQAEVIVRMTKEDIDMENQSATSLFILECDTQDPEGPGCLATWGTEQPTKYRLRHLITGRLLGHAHQSSNSTLSLMKHAHELEAS